MNTRSIRRLVGALALAICGSAAAQQAYPSRPVHVVVPFAAGSTIEVFTRSVLEDIQRRTGATFVVESKPGALGAIGTEAVARAAPDGYTLMPSSSATHSSGPRLARSVPYDVSKDFTQLGAIVRFDLMLVTNGAGPLRTVADLVADGRKRKLLYGFGSATGQVGASAFSRAAGVGTEGVSYKGQPLAVNDLVGGHIDFAMSDLASVSAQVKAGRLHALAISSDRRSTLFPDVPTLAEAGLPVVLVGWVGLAGPARLPAEVREWWTRQLVEALGAPSVVQRLGSIGAEPFVSTGDAFERFVQQQYELWGRHIREAGIEPQ